MYYNLALLVKYSEPHPTMFLITACYYNRVSEKKAADTFSQWRRICEHRGQSTSDWKI